MVCVYTNKQTNVHMNRNLDYIQVDLLVCIPSTKDCVCSVCLLMACGLLILTSVFTANYNMCQE